MEESTMEQNDKISLLGKAMHVGEQLAEVEGKAARLKTAASHAVEDAVTEAKRFAKRSRYAAKTWWKMQPIASSVIRYAQLALA
jgi:hypothetical protein